MIDNPTGGYIDRYLGRYECVNESSNKFWECLHQHDNQFIVRWGKIGAKNPQTKEYTDIYYLINQVRKKENSGYKYIRGSLKTFSEIEKSVLCDALNDFTSKDKTPSKKRVM